MTAITDADSVHRLVKALLDSGEAKSLEEAEQMFFGYKLCLTVGPDEVTNPYEQATLLTAVALARRVFLGGVTVSGNLSVPHMTNLPIPGTLADAVVALGGAPGAEEGPVRVAIGGSARRRASAFHVRTSIGGWSGGVVPVDAQGTTLSAEPMALAPMLAAGLAVSEAYSCVSGQSRAAGYRSVGLSLWAPSASTSCLQADAAPRLAYLPKSLWLLGLGHLGQAFLWGLGLLPYSRALPPELVLQDKDIVTESTESTSILSDATLLKKKKTRAMAEWAERRGFQTCIVERWFDANTRRQRDEPSIALCGLDNGVDRRALESAGFDFVVEAGLGQGHQDFRTMRLHTFPGSKSASELWKASSTLGKNDKLQAGYENLVQAGVLNQCGATLLAGKAVGAPFVGAVAACLVLSEVLRLLHQGTVHQVIDLDLECIEQRIALPNATDFGGLNPGFLPA